MRYMQSFNQHLQKVREQLGLSVAELAELCGVEEQRVRLWEHSDPRNRAYPSVGELMDLCLRTETSLEGLLDLDEVGDEGQLELPGLAFSDGSDLTRALNELERELGRLQLSDEEAELLRRFRRTTADNRRMIMQILGH